MRTLQYGLALIFLWLIPAFLFALQWAFDASPDAHSPSFWTLFLRSLPRWIVWAPLTPTAIWMARRIAVRTGGLEGFRRAVGWHVIATLGISIPATLVWAAGPVMESAKTPYWRIAAMLWPVSVVWSMPIYAAIAALTYAFDARLAGERLEKQLAEARLEVLHAQLRPHFFFNTLHSIASLIRANRSSEAVSMIARLGELIRETLQEGGTRTTVAREIELVRLYLEIQKVRFPDRLHVDFDIEPATNLMTLPSLLLQPLVENAIDHGIAHLPQGGGISIRSRREGERLVLEVRNTGSLRQAFSEGVGIRNTKQRLSQSYGERQSFVMREDEGHVTVRLEIPW